MVLIKPPVSALCLSDCWHTKKMSATNTITDVLSVCPGVLAISSTWTTNYILINFASRGWAFNSAGVSCYFGEPYLVYNGGGGGVVPTYAHLDVWRAYKDGVWTSSVTIEITHAASTITILTPCGDTDSKTISGSSPTCPGLTAKATVTFYDDGTFTLA